MYVTTVPTCLSVSICPPPPPQPDRYADYGYRVNSHLRRVKKGENKNKSLYTKRTRETTPSLSPPSCYLTSASSLQYLYLSAYLSLAPPSPGHHHLTTLFAVHSTPCLCKVGLFGILSHVLYVCDFSARFSYVVFWRDNYLVRVVFPRYFTRSLVLRFYTSVLIIL